MHKPFLSLLALFSLLATTTIDAANAPSSIVGKKMVVNYQSSDGESGVHTVIVDSSTQVWEYDNDDGEWELNQYTWEVTGSNQATYKEGVIPVDYAELFFTFSNSNSGSFTGKLWDTENGQPILGGELSGTFTISTPAESELPPLDRYFSDDFSDPSKSTENWALSHLSQHHGLVIKQGNGNYTLVGKFTPDGDGEDDRWLEVAAKSLIPLKESWYVQAKPFINFDSTINVNPRISLIIASENLYFEISCGLTFNAKAKGEFWHDNEKQWEGYHDYSSINPESYRIRNNHTEKSLICQYLTNGSWQNIFSFNWETGTYLSKDGSTGKAVNWQSVENLYAQPAMSFEVPNDSSNVIQTIESNQLGFSSFSVIEGAPVSAPDSLVGKKIRISFVETANDAEGVHEFYFAGNGKGWMRYWLESNDPSDETYWDDDNFTYQISGENSALLKLGTNEDYSEIPLTFTSENAGSFTAQGWKIENGSLVQTGPMNATGSFTLSDYDESELPASQGWLWFDQYPWVYSDEEKNWLYFLPSNGMINVYSVRDKAWREMTKTE
ncbi:MAG: hypothetical protein HN727_16765 [Opitutae bacterium]|nr:hypothetical protein [Opitutae bacterium]